ncbi:MAG: hypothetical protein WBL45_05660 [Solirubrobacterales bacterium]
MSSLRLTTLALVLTALALAGCGGGDDEETTASTPTTTEAPPTLSKEELISQGDAICAEVNAAVGSVGSTGSGVQDQTIQVATLYTGMVERLNDLGEPEDPAGYPEFIAASEELAQVEGEVKLSAEQADTAALGEAATRATPALEEFQSAAGEYGFESCSEGPTAPAVTGTEGGVPSGEEEVAPEATEEPEVEPEAEISPGTGEEEVAPEGGGTGPGAGGGDTEDGGSSGGIGAE